MTDDCGDLSDEDGLFCVNQMYSPNSFETDDEPFGMFTTGGEDRFHWQRGSGRTENSRTGPPFDHSLFDASGHYLYIDSSYSGEDKFAELGRFDSSSSSLNFVKLFLPYLGNEEWK